MGGLKPPFYFYKCEETDSRPTDIPVITDVKKLLKSDPDFTTFD